MRENNSTSHKSSYQHLLILLLPVLSLPWTSPCHHSHQTWTTSNWQKMSIQLPQCRQLLQRQLDQNKRLLVLVLPAALSLWKRIQCQLRILLVQFRSKAIANKVRRWIELYRIYWRLCIFWLQLFFTGSQGPSLVFNKRKKLEIKAVFNADEDDTAAPKKRKLVPLGRMFIL